MNDISSFSEHQLTCRYFNRGCCSLVGQLVGSNSVVVKPDACKACTENSDRPRQVNNVVATLAIGWITRHNRIDLGPVVTRLKSFLTKVKRRPLELGEGIGTELHLVLKGKGFEIEPDCPCLAQIIKLNNSTVRQCVDTVEETVDVMVKEARRRKLKVLGVEPPDIVMRQWCKKRIKEAVRRWNKRLVEIH